MNWTWLKPLKRLAVFALCLGSFSLLALQGCFLFEDDKESYGGPTTRGYYRITFPASGSALNLDSTYQVLWAPSTGAEGGNVRIALYQGDAFRFYLTSLTSNSGAYNWALPTTRSASGYRLGSGSNYRLRITSSVDTAKWDNSPVFSIRSEYSGNIKVTTPASGTMAKLDSSMTIRWESSGEHGPNVGIQLYKDTVLMSTIASLAPNNGYYQWSRVSTGLGSGNDYHIRVFSLSDPSIQDMGAPFRIVSSYDGKFELTSPGTGDTLVAGTYAGVAWNVTGNAGTYASLSLYKDSTYVRSVVTSVLLSYGDSTSWLVTSGLATGSRYRIRMVSSSDPGIVAWSGFFTIKGSDPDEYESDDSLKLAKPIVADGNAQQHTLTNLDLDWLRFNALKGKRYLVTVRGATGVTVYTADSSGNFVGSSMSGTNFNMVVTPAVAGRHHLRVSTYSGYGPYSIALTEYDSTESSARVVFTSPDSNAIWAAGSSYAIRWTPDSLFYGTTVTLALYNDTVFSQSITSSNSNSGTYTWSLPSTLLSSSKYRIRIASYQNTQVYSFSPRFTVSGLAPDAYEPDNTLPTAKVLPTDGMAQTRTVTSGDYDWIRINAKAGKKYLASFNSPTVTLYTTLNDSAGRLISTQNGSQFSVTVSPAYDGPYYIQVQGSSSYGSYTALLVEYDANQGGFPVRFTAPDTSSIWASGSYYTITWSPDIALYGSSISLALYRDSVLVQSITSGGSNLGSYSWTVPTGLVTSGRYRIRISNYSNTQLYGFSPFFTISGLTPDAFEPDNQRALAKDIPLDGTPQSRNHTLSDSDWVKFDGVAGKTYLINTVAVTTLYLYALDSSGLSLGYNSGTRFSLVVKPTRNGKVYLRSQPSSGTGSYTLSALSYDGGPNGIPAKFITPDTSSTWATGTAYSITWTPDTLLFGRYVSLALYADTVFIQSLSTSVLNTGTYSVTVPLGLSSGSNYRIRMTNTGNTTLFGNSAPFTVSGQSPDAQEPNDSAAAAKAATPNAARQTLSLTYRDRDWFKFTGKAQMLYIFQAVSGSTLPTTMRLYSGLGVSQLITNSKTSIDSVNSIAWVCPADGQYSLLVEPYSVSTSYYGNYGFEIKEVDPSTYKFTVTSPVKDGTASLGQSVPILWTDPSGVKGYVDLFLYNTEGVVLTIAANISNTGSYSWVVPSTLALRGGYYVRILSRLNGAISGNSGTFSVGP